VPGDSVSAMRPVDAAERWARVWREAWEARDTDAIVALYAPGARFSTHAFRVPYSGRGGARAASSG
jgi:ketosteroid isomerase-like protein